jgi:hypothetical protein
MFWFITTFFHCRLWLSIVKPAYNRPPSVYGYITSCERLSRTGRAGQRRANQLDNLLSGIGGYPGRDILRTGIGWMNGRVLCGLLNVFLHFLFLSFDNRDSLLLLFACNRSFLLPAKNNWKEITIYKHDVSPLPTSPRWGEDVNDSACLFGCFRLTDWSVW